MDLLDGAALLPEALGDTGDVVADHAAEHDAVERRHRPPLEVAGQPARDEHRPPPVGEAARHRTHAEGPATRGAGCRSYLAGIVDGAAAGGGKPRARRREPRRRHSAAAQRRCPGIPTALGCSARRAGRSIGVPDALLGDGMDVGSDLQGRQRTRSTQLCRAVAPRGRPCAGKRKSVPGSRWPPRAGTRPDGARRQGHGLFRGVPGLALACGVWKWASRCSSSTPPWARCRPPAFPTPATPMGCDRRARRTAGRAARRKSAPEPGSGRRLRRFRSVMRGRWWHRSGRF